MRDHDDTFRTFILQFILEMKRTAILAAILALVSCSQKPTDSPEEFVFLTDNIEGDEEYYSKPAVITGHIANRDVYPNTAEINLTIPFYDRVDSRQSSMIFDDRFAFALLPYAPRTVSMEPYIDHLVVCPGDSIHIELDFAQLGKVGYSGIGADNNVKLNEFHLRYYLSEDWPFDKDYADAESYAEAAKEKLEYHLSRLEDFINDQKPGVELERLCRKEIEADYYSELIQSLLRYQRNGQKVKDHFRVKDAEDLFSLDCVSGNLFELSQNISLWLLYSIDQKEALRLTNDYSALNRFIRKSVRNKALRQMMTTYFYNLLLEANDTEAFEKNFASFNENVTYPLLKLNTRDRYVVKKAFKENPRLLSDAILQADKSGEGQAFVKANEGLKLLRSVISKAEDKVVYINIGATWCPGTRHEIPHQVNLADTLKSEPLRIVNFYLDNNSDGINPFHPMIETYHLTEEQRAGLDPILHTGRGIPFYILIDKDGTIVDFGEHLRPSIPKTRDILETYLDE